MNIGEDTLCSLMDGLDSQNSYIDRNQEVIEMGRKLNVYIENYGRLSRDQIEQFLDEINDLFHVYKANLIDKNPVLTYEPNWVTAKYMNPKEFSRNQHIKKCIEAHIMLDKSRYSLHSLLMLARTVFIQIYLFVNEEKICVDKVDSNDIFDYPKPITFFEHELNDLNNLMENMM
jgi:ribosome biogenesis protein Nip4